MQSVSRGEDYAVVFGRVLAETHTSVRRLAHLSGISRRTLENWLDGTVRRPRHWEPILRVAHVLHLQAADVDTLLLAAGQPGLAAIRESHLEQPAADLLVLWQPNTDVNSEEEAAQPLLLSTLPTPATPFVGREAQLLALSALVNRPDVRLITVVGPGGIGKTRLALKVARHSADAFADGVCFVSLESANTAEALLERLMAGLGIRHDPAIPAIEAIMSSIRDRQMLLVLDTFERLLSAAGLVAEIVQSAPQLKVLVTSRAVLRLSAEHIYAVPNLSVGPEIAPPEFVARYEAVSLFTARVQAVQPDFELTADNSSNVLAICRLLGGLPLALELAAAQTRILSLRELRRQLEGGSDLLVGGPRDAPVRQRSIQDTLSWSYHLLSTEEQMVLRRLSVYCDGCTVAAAQAVATADMMTEGRFIATLTGLLDQSLLQFQRVGSQRIYRMHDLTRQFAFSRLIESGERDLVMSQFLEFLEGLAERVERHMRDGERTYWLSQFDPEADNIWLALEWGLSTDQPDTVVQCLRLCGMMRQYWNLRGQVDLGRKWTERALDAARRLALPEAVQIRALLNASALALIQADGQTSAERATLALKAARETGDRNSEADALHLLGLAAYYRGDLVDARDLWDSALHVAEQLGNGSVIALALDDLGNLASRQGDLELSLSLHQREQEVSIAVGDHYSEFYAVLNLGDVSIRLNRLSDAEQYNGRAMELSREMGDVRGLAHTMITQARLLRQLERLSEARDLLLEALTISWRIKNLDIVLTALEQLLITGTTMSPHTQVHLMGLISMHRGQYGPTSYPEDDAALQVLAAQLEQQMGEETYSRAWGVGQALSWEAAVQLSIKDGHSMPGLTHSAKSLPNAQPAITRDIRNPTTQ